MSENKKVSLTELNNTTKKKTQLFTLAQIIEEFSTIPKSMLETIFVIRILKEFGNNLDEIEEAVIQGKKIKIPGDVQKQIRTFYYKNKKYGLSCEDKIYTWNPILEEELECIIRPAARNIFKTKKEKEQFINDKKNKCEICECEPDRGAIDHFRAHSIYNIDDKKIAVHLCEKCNNIHHNHDASILISKYKHNITIITNWIKIENRIKKIYPPNETDLVQQKKNINIVNEYFTENNILVPEEFWQGLF